MHTTKDYLRWRDNMASAARENLERDGSLTPVAVLSAPTGVFVIDLRHDTLDEKDAADRGLRAMARILGAEACMVVMEAWFATVDWARPDFTTPPSERADRREVVLVSLELPGVTYMSANPILRVEGQAPTFGPPEWRECRADEWAGRFAQVLPANSMSSSQAN